MGTQVAKAEKGLFGLAALDNLDDKINQLVAETGATLGSYLQFSGKTGEYKLNGAPIEKGTVFAFNVQMARKGVICWKDEKPIKRDTVLVLSGDAAPAIPDEEEQNEGEDWRTLIEIPVKTLDTGEQAEFGLSSKGGTRALTRLISDWGQRVRMNMDKTGQPKVCLVSVDAEQFKTKDEKGKPAYAFAPRFKIVEWVSAADLVGGIGSQAEEEAASEDAPEVEPEVETAPPKSTAKAPTPAAAATTRPVTGFGSGLRGVRK